MCLPLTPQKKRIKYVCVSGYIQLNTLFFNLKELLKPYHFWLL